MVDYYCLIIQNVVSGGSNVNARASEGATSSLEHKRGSGFEFSKYNRLLFPL